MVDIGKADARNLGFFIAAVLKSGLPCFDSFSFLMWVSVSLIEPLTVDGDLGNDLEEV